MWPVSGQQSSSRSATCSTSQRQIPPLSRPATRPAAGGSARRPVVGSAASGEGAPANVHAAHASRANANASRAAASASAAARAIAHHSSSIQPHGQRSGGSASDARPVVRQSAQQARVAVRPVVKSRATSGWPPLPRAAAISAARLGQTSPCPLRQQTLQASITAASCGRRGGRPGQRHPRQRLLRARPRPATRVLPLCQLRQQRLRCQQLSPADLLGRHWPVPQGQPSLRTSRSRAQPAPASAAPPARQPDPSSPAAGVAASASGPDMAWA